MIKGLNLKHERQDKIVVRDLNLLNKSFYHLSTAYIMQYGVIDIDYYIYFWGLI